MTNSLITKEELKKKLAESNKSNRQLAAFMGTQPSTISRMLSGKLNIRKRDSMAIDAFFNQSNQQIINNTSGNIRIMPDSAMMPTIPPGYQMEIIETTLETRMMSVHYLELNNNKVVVGRVMIKGNRVIVFPDNADINESLFRKEDIKKIYLVKSAKKVFEI